MKKLLLAGILLFSNAIVAQIDIDFNNQTLPQNWTTQGSFEIQNAEIYPKCQQNALVGTFFEPNSNFWVQTNTLEYHGGNIQINMVFGIKDLYHALGVSSPFQKPNLFVEYSNGNSNNWIQHSQIPLQNIEASTNCIHYDTTLNASELQDFETIKFRFVYQSPEQTGSIYLLYWSLDTLKITQEKVITSVCTENLGGGLEPSFVTLRINGTSFEHNTYSEPTEYYHAYPQTATLNAGLAYDIYTFTSSEAVIGIWMDYNQNNVFEDSEYKELVNNMNSQNTTSFTVSAASNSGNVKMRIRSRAYGSSVGSSDACTTFGSGETRDYVFTVNNALGIEEPVKFPNPKVYPNPTSGFINIETAAAIKNVAVYNMMGQMVLNTISNKVDISNVPHGTFILEITSADNQKSYSRIVKK